jgi:hypothetical protein
VYDLFPPGYLESIGLHPESIAAAALNAWPGACIRTRMQPDPMNGGQWIMPEKMLSLPLPKEGE